MNDWTYTNRIKSRNRCVDCKMQQSLCICTQIPNISLQTKLSLIIHYRETVKTTNTGLLAARALNNSEVRVRGGADRISPYEGLFDYGKTHLYLYPENNAVELNDELIASMTKPINLVVPDGTWSQAKRVFRRIPDNHLLMPVILPGQHQSEYRLRHLPQKHQTGLATLEAIAKAIGMIESPEAEKALMHTFRIMVSRTLLSRGEIKPEQVYGGLD